MVRNMRVKALLTELQYELLKSKAEQLGYKNKTQYARDVILQDDFHVEKMVNEIYEVTCKNVRR